MRSLVGSDQKPNRCLVLLVEMGVGEHALERRVCCRMMCLGKVVATGGRMGRSIWV